MASIDQLREFHEISRLSGLPIEPVDQWLETFNPEVTEIWPIQKEGQVIGGVLFWHHTIHIAVLPEWHGKWLTKEMLKSYPKWKHDCPIVAVINPRNHKAKALAKKLGFNLIESRYDYSYFVKEPTHGAPSASEIQTAAA